MLLITPRLWQVNRACACGLLIVLFGVAAFGLGQPQYVESTCSAGSFPVANSQQLAAVYVDSKDYPGVMRAAHDLALDVERVTGRRPELLNAPGQAGSPAIIVGTIGMSALVDGLISAKKIDAAAVAGHWESFLIEVVADPLPGVKRRWSSREATSAARSTASTTSPNRWECRPGTGGRTSRCGAARCFASGLEDMCRRSRRSATAGFS